MDYCDIPKLITIIGFIVFLIAGRESNVKGMGVSDTATTEKNRLIDKKYEWAYWSVKGHAGHILRLVAIPLILFGLIIDLFDFCNSL